jgi:ribosomal protein S21
MKKNKKNINGVLEVHNRGNDSNDFLVSVFKRKCKKLGLLSEIRSHYLGRHKSKSEKKREKHKRAISRMLRLKK